MPGSTVSPSRLLAFALAAVIFAAGGVAGVAADRLWLGATDSTERARWHDRSVTEQLERYRERFALTDEQAAQIEPILHRVKREIAGARASTRARARADIMAVLTAEQQTEYRALLERIDARRR